VTVDAWSEMDAISKFFKWFVLVAAAAGLLFAAWLFWSAEVARSQVVAQTILFTWPGDDGNVGTASSLDLRWSRNAIVGADTLSWWNAATKFTGTYPVPKIAGTPDSVIVLGLPNDTFLYYIAKACDEVPNCSGFSNVASGKTKDFVPPSPPGNVRLGTLLRRFLAPPPAFAREPDQVPPAVPRLTATPLAV